MKTVILAAGKGTRMKELTADIPKPLLRINNKPILEYILNKLKFIGIKDVLLIVGYLSEKIKDYFGDGKKFGLNIYYIEQVKQEGTGEAVGIAKEWVDNEPFFLANGDVWISVNDYKNFIDTYYKFDSDILLSLNWVEDPYYGGAVYIDNEFTVTKIIEKPAKGTSQTNYINAGLYVFKPIIFDYIKKIKPSIRGEYELPDAITMMLQEKKYIIKGYIFQDKWIDIGTPEALKAVEKICAAELQQCYCKTKFY